MKISLLGTNKESKKVVKKVLKKMGHNTAFKWSNAMTVQEANQSLTYIGKWMETQNIKQVSLGINIVDTEGEIESKGTIYTFEGLTFEPVESYYPTILELIREDIFKETDETMSAEESYRNDKILEAIELGQSLDETIKPENASSVEKRKPWQRVPNDDKASSKEFDTGGKNDESDDENFEETSFKEVVFTEELEEPEQDIEEEESSIEQDDSIQEQFRDPEPVAKPVIQEFKPSYALSEEVITELKTAASEVEKITDLERALDVFPAKEEWMAPDQQLFLNKQFQEKMLPDINQAYLSGQEDYINQAQGMLKELVDTFNQSNWKVAAENKLSQFFKELEEKQAKEEKQYTEAEVANFEEKMAHLNEEEQIKITEAVEAIKKNYLGKKDQLRLASKERLDTFVSRQNQELIELKEKELLEKTNELKQLKFNELEDQKQQVMSELLGLVTELKQSTKEKVNEKYTHIQQELDKQRAIWEANHKALEEEKALAIEKEKQEKASQLELEIRQREADLKAQEIQFEKEKQEKEYEIELSKIRLKEEQLEQRKKEKEEYFDAMLDPIMHSQRSPLNNPSMPIQNKPGTNEVPIPLEKSQGVSSSSVNKWVTGCFVMASLLVGGGVMAGINHTTQEKIASEQTSLLEKQSKEIEAMQSKYDQQLEETQKKYDKQLSQKLSEVEQASNDKDRESKLQKLADSIINYDSQTALGIYESLSDQDKKELTSTQKESIKVFYQDKGQDKKAAEVK